MKKYLYSALALPLLFACSSEDFDKEVISNNQFAGIEKVDATFLMDGEGATTRMATEWKVELGDKFGFAWLGDGTKINPATTGEAYQNHPLTVVNETGRGKIFKPATSIYVGKYYLYAPYDYETVNIGAINFKSLENQTLAEGKNDPWPSLAKNAIIIGDKWTDVKVGGTVVSGKTWDEPGIDKPFQIFSAFFSNQTALDLTYVKNNPTFAAGGKAISGATDIAYTYPAGTEIGAADIYKVTVDLDGAAKSFTYAPKAEPNNAAHNGNFWETKKNQGAGEGFTFTDDVITLNAPEGAPISTGANGSTGWFWFNSLPATAGGATSATNVTTVFTTSYGDVTVTKTLAECGWAFEDPAQLTADHEISGSKWTPEWIQLAAADAAKTASTPLKWKPDDHNTFVNQYGNHKGKYKFDVDFSTGIMNGMDINDDAHLQKALKYYIASGKAEVATLDLQPASATDNTFKLSKISIALLQTINSTADKVLVNPTGVKVIITQDGQGDLGLADKKEVPALNNVFSVATNVYLSKECDWTWSGRSATPALDYKAAIPVDNMVTSITNEGTASTKLTVNAENIELWNVDTDNLAATTLTNAKGATMDITKVTTVKNALTNLGTINVGSASNTAAELRAYGVDITNDATSLTASGTIENFGVVGVTAGTGGHFYNYGLIDMKQSEAITLLTANQTGGNFASAWAAANKMGTVVLPANNPTALVSVSNATDQGFIKYDMRKETPTAITYATPAGNVKYNTIIVNGDITFTAEETEIQYIEFDGTRTQVINPSAANKLTQLKGIHVYSGKSIIIEKTNIINCSQGAYLGSGATVYRGGLFQKNGAPFAANDALAANNYLGAWSLDQIVEY